MKQKIETYAGPRVVSWLPNGYGTFTIDGVRHYLHQYVYETHYGPIPPGYQVDHIDTDKANNSPDNLRLATVSENRCNVATRRDSSTGIKGVSSRQYMGCTYWCASIQKDGRRYTKNSRVLQEVRDWLDTMRLELHGAFSNRGTQ